MASANEPGAAAGGPAGGASGPGGPRGSRPGDDPAARVEAVLRRLGTDPAGLEIVAELAGLPAGSARRIAADLVRAGRAVEAGGPDRFLHRDGVAAAARRAAAGIGEFHRQMPGRPGIEPHPLRIMTEVIPEVFDAALAALRADGRIVEENGLIRLAEFRPPPD